MPILVTGSAGFIGFHLSKALLDRGFKVIGLDSFTPYYDVKLKKDRSHILESNSNFHLYKVSLEDSSQLEKIIKREKPRIVVHLAAQAGVRYSIENPSVYMESNLVGTMNLLEAMVQNQPEHFMFASTSSVYGGNLEQPFKETHRTDFPASLYAATKRGGEALSHAYSHIYRMPTTCFRFFTVYGPWGRPDMALFKFVDQILKDIPIEVYGNGNMFRDFTYVDDLIDSILGLIPSAPVKTVNLQHSDSISPTAPWRVVNLGGGQPIPLLDFIHTIEDLLGIEAKKIMLPMQPGDVVSTHADPSLLEGLYKMPRNTSLKEGIGKFVDWYKHYYLSNI